MLLSIDHAGASSGARLRRQQGQGLLALSAALLLLMTPLLIVVDTFNGALLRGAGISGLSQAVKTAYLALLACYALHTRSGVLVLCACIISNAVFVLVHSLSDVSVGSVMDDAQWLLRFNILWLGYHAFTRMTRDGLVDSRWLFKCFGWVSAVLFANLLLGTLGYGYSQYGKSSDSEQIGAVGFIYAGNEMSFMILLCQVILCGMLYHQKGRMVPYLVVCALFLVASVLKATKVAILGSVIVALAFPAIDMFRGALSFKMASMRGPIIGFVAIASVVAASPFIIQLVESTGLFRRMEYFFHEYGLAFVIFSGREEFTREFLSDVWSRYSVVEYVFGPGRHEMLLRLGHPVEIDVFDIVGSFGFLGLILYYGPFIWAWCKGSRTLLRSSDALTISFVLSSILLLVSVTAGHVIYSGLAAPYLAAAFGYLFSAASPRDMERSAHSENSGAYHAG